jgi:natural product precursor
MKTLSKIKLQNAVALEEQEMKRIYGGSGSSGGSGGSGGVCDGYEFICGCNDGTGGWCANYESQEDLRNAIETYCSGSGGTCMNTNP